jgi:hypothetical protein
MLLPIVHRSFDVGGLKIEGPPPPEKPPFMAIIATLARMPIAANIPAARNIILIGVIVVTINQTLKKENVQNKKNKDYWTTMSN